MTVGEFKQRVRWLPKSSLGCKVWDGARGSGGYGIVTINGKKQRAHRASFQHFNGPLENGLFVCHKCDCPPCVNPDHLFQATHAENMLDMSQKGRARSCAPPTPTVPVFQPVGEICLLDGPRAYEVCGKMVTIHLDPMRGWHGTVDNKNILNPWTKTLFKHRRSCARVASFYARKGFYPGLKPNHWRTLHGIAQIT